jgi:hypothetical protein
MADVSDPSRARSCFLNRQRAYQKGVRACAPRCVLQRGELLIVRSACLNMATQAIVLITYWNASDARMTSPPCTRRDPPARGLASMVCRDQSCAFHERSDPDANISQERPLRVPIRGRSSSRAPLRAMRRSIHVTRPSRLRRSRSPRHALRRLERPIPSHTAACAIEDWRGLSRSETLQGSWSSRATDVKRPAFSAAGPHMSRLSRA